MKPLNPKDQHLDLRTEQNLCLGLQGAHVPCADKKSECTDCETVFAPQLYNSYDSMSILFTHTHTHTHTHTPNMLFCTCHNNYSHELHVFNEKIIFL